MYGFVKFWVFFDYQDSAARIKIHDSSIQLVFSSRDVSLEPLMEKFNLVCAEKIEFQNLRVINNNLFLEVSACRELEKKT